MVVQKIELPTKTTQDAIKTGVDAVKTTLATVNTNVNSVKTDVSNVNTNVNTVKTQTTAIQTAVNNLNTASLLNGTFKHFWLTNTVSSEQDNTVKILTGKMLVQELYINIGSFSGLHVVTLRLDDVIYGLNVDANSQLILTNIPVKNILSIKVNYNFVNHVNAQANYILF